MNGNCRSILRHLLTYNIHVKYVHVKVVDCSSWAASIFYVDSLGGRGVRKMPILLNKISTKGGRGVKKVQNLVYVEYGCPLRGTTKT